MDSTISPPSTARVAELAGQVAASPGGHGASREIVALGRQRDLMGALLREVVAILPGSPEIQKRIESALAESAGGPEARVMLNGAQILQLVALSDAVQGGDALETEVVVSQSAEGARAWLAEYPEEGFMVLDPEMVPAESHCGQDARSEAASGCGNGCSGCGCSGGTRP